MIPAADRVEEVFDHAAELAVRALDTDGEVVRKLVLVTEERLVDVLAFEIRIDRRGAADEAVARRCVRVAARCHAIEERIGLIGRRIGREVVREGLQLTSKRGC